MGSPEGVVALRSVSLYINTCSKAGGLHKECLEP